MTDGRQTEKDYLVKQAADDLRRKGFTIYAVTTNTPFRIKVRSNYIKSHWQAEKVQLFAERPLIYVRNDKN